jgi:hypothetical protein
VKETKLSPVSKSPTKIMSPRKSPRRLKASLKDLKSPSKKNLKLVVKREFLHMGPPVVGISRKYIVDLLQQNVKAE